MDYIKIIYGNIDAINRRLDELVKFLETEYKKEFNLKTTKTFRQHLNGILDNIEDIECFKSSLMTLENKLADILENNISRFNMEKVKHVANMLEKTCAILINTSDKHESIRFITKIATRIKNIAEGESENENNNITIDDMVNLNMSQLVRFIVQKLAAEDKLTEKDILNIKNADWCKTNLMLNYPLIKYINEEDIDDPEQRKVNGYRKYYRDPIAIKGHYYLLCNDLTEKSRDRFMKWFKIKYDLVFDEFEELSIDSESLILENDDKDVYQNAEENVDGAVFDDPFKLLNWIERNSQ